MHDGAVRRPPQDHTAAFTGTDASFTMRPIAIARTPYRERYGTPHQSTTTRGTRQGTPAEATIELVDGIPVEALRGLEGFDRVWLLYVFHMNEGWSPMVRPPRGPRVKRGVLATRSPHRPCPIGLSAVELVAVEGRTLRVRCVDLLDGTPVLDVKPYVPYADAFPTARAGWVDEVDALERAAASGDPDARETADEGANADAESAQDQRAGSSSFESGTP